ncbi:MAG: hypothetical protein P4L03_07430 [Terracidiphilus sp.]|nr:hypothetical protein [Terracidiphilus sp.]
MAALWICCAAAGVTAVAQSKPQEKQSTNEAQLAKAHKMYYSATRDGLTGFDCAAHPEWRTTFMDARGGKLTEDDVRKIAALQTVKIVLHGRLKGQSSLEWVETDPSSTQAFADVLKSMHESLEQTLMGFMQFWVPFIDAQVIPESSEGLTITHTDDGGITVRGGDAETSVTEIFDANLILRHYNVKMKNAQVLFDPIFTPTAKGLRVSYFVAHLRQGENAEQEMHVGVTYGETGGFPVPVQMDMEVIGTGHVNVTMDGCVVNP